MYIIIILRYNNFQIMKIPFRRYHIIEIFNNFNKTTLPLDVFLRDYFKKNKSIGSKDRKEIVETLYKIIRYKALLDNFIKKPATIEKRLEILDTLDLDKIYNDKNISDYIKVSFPKDFFDLIHNTLKENSIDFCKYSNSQAPITIRANLLKTTQEELFENFKNRFDIEKTKKSPYGITFKNRINFFEMDEFKKGFFEIQDEGSQLVADLIDIQPKDKVLDYCSGSGGKTLAIAHKMGNSGQIFIHDIRQKALLEAKKRFKRAGIQNFQLYNNQTFIDKLILDVPCSGSGTIRRNPDMKWRFSIDNLKNLINTQKEIFDK